MRLLLIAGIMALVTAGARAEETTDAPAKAEEINPLLAACLKEQPAELAAQACTVAVESRQLQGDALAGALYARGVAYGRRGQLPTAINDFTAALNLTPEATDVLYARGSAQAAQKQHDLALVDFSAILKIEPTDADSLYRRAWSYTMLGRDKEAIADLTGVLAGAPEDIDALMDRGGLYLRDGNFKAAIGDFDAILKLEPGAAAAFYNRGRAEALGNNFAAAAKDFAAAEEKRSGNPYAALRRYLALAGGGKPDPQVLTKVTASFPADQWPLPVLATLAGDYREEDLLASAELAERTVAQRLVAEARFYLGEAALAKKDEKTARAHFEAAAKGERTVPEVVDAGWRLKQLTP